MESITLTLSGNSSSLHASYYPEIVLDDRFQYMCALVDFNTYNSVPNVCDNNKFHIKKEDGTDMELVIPEGAYDAQEIIDLLNSELKKHNIILAIAVEIHTMKCILTSSENIEIDFTAKNTIGHLLGFKSKKIRFSNECLEVKSDHIIDIKHANVLRIDCNIATGSYINENSSHTIHEFYPTVGLGYKIVEVPRNLIYLPIVGETISHLNIKIVDENGKLVNFRGETITVRIHIKRL